VTDPSHNDLLVVIIINAFCDASARYDENKRKSRIIVDLLIR
jgi:hypothetical protein